MSVSYRDELRKCARHDVRFRSLLEGLHCSGTMQKKLLSILTKRVNKFSESTARALAESISRCKRRTRVREQLAEEMLNLQLSGLQTTLSERFAWSLQHFIAKNHHTDAPLSTQENLPYNYYTRSKKRIETIGDAVPISSCQ